MSQSIIYSRARFGIDAPQVTVEAHLSNGLPSFSIVGLPEKAVKESRDRVRSALLNSRFEFPARRITVNLAPADLPKEGGRFDLPIAISILVASRQLQVNFLAEYEFVGELALSGELRPITGILPAALGIKNSGRKLIIPFNNREEASLVAQLEIFPAKTILEVCAHLKGKAIIEPYTAETGIKNTDYILDMNDVCGQRHARRALEIAASGEHSVLFIGPPGTGKTMLANRMPTILPPMTEREAIESASIASISKKFNVDNWRKRPFRSPHHSASSVALVGGGNPPRPGEISLAHRGVLFLDELTEFNRHVLEALREPLESGCITISRAARQSEFPAAFQLIAAMNPCPCGYYGDPRNNCRCTQEQILRYRQKISGPILDRIDMQIEVPRIPISALMPMHELPVEPSKTIQKRVMEAREKQLNRANKSNAELSNKEIKKYCVLSQNEQRFIETAVEKLALSARSYHKILKISLTVADLESSEKITKKHLAEALSYRKMF